MRHGPLFCLGLALAACAPASVAPVSRAQPVLINIQPVANWAPARCAADPALEHEQPQLIAEINRSRQDHGLGAVRYDPRLAAAAQEHACDNAQAGAISHTGPGGTRPGQRALRAGYDYRIVVENLGLGFNDAAQAMFYWMRSPGHRDNLLNPQVHDAALGLTLTAKGQKVWVLMLGQSR